jgi:hypothetical protein
MIAGVMMCAVVVMNTEAHKVALTPNRPLYTQGRLSMSSALRVPHLLSRCAGSHIVTDAFSLNTLAVSYKKKRLYLISGDER